MNRVLILVLFFCPLLLRAQEPLFIQHEIGDANLGIPINRMLQDHQAMIWLGTNNGLVRYDGNEWYPTVLDSFAPPAQVTSLMEDVNGKIWVGTSYGQIYFLDLARKVHAFDIEEGHPAKPITSIVQDRQGQIWFATYGEGVYVYTGSRLYNFGMDDGLAANDVYAMTSTPNGEIWLGTDDGINIVSLRKDQKLTRSLGLKEGLPDQIITSLESDTYGNVWIGTFENGIAYYDAGLNKVIQPFESSHMDEITSFDIFDGKELWIGTRKSGVWRYNADSKFLRKLVNLQASHGGEISDIMSDVEGNVWVSMEEGVLLSAFRPFESLVTNVGEIQTLFCDHLDQVWIGSKNGLFRIEENIEAPSSATRILPEYNFNITDIYEDRFRNLWIATLDKGLFIYNPADGKVKTIPSQELPANTVMSIAGTTREIWIATLQGVVSYDASKNIFTEKAATFDLVSAPWQSTLHFVFQVFVDSKDRAWFATDGNGVYCIDDTKVQQFLGNDSIVIRTVYSVSEDHSGHLWFNTPGIGLVEFDGHTYKPLSTSEGLGNINIASIATAGTGDIIIAHHRGIDLVEPERRHFMYYKDEIGAKNFDPALNSVATNSKGHVFISGNNLILKYYAAEDEFSIHPMTQITGVSIYGQRIDHTTEHSFTYNQNYISFDYIGLWYSSPKSVKYLYKLQGYDLDWKESRDHVATYSSLPPGEYTFAVKASENKFFLDEPLTFYSFAIAKPFWLQYWFIVSILLISASLFYLIVKSRERRSERQALVKRDMIESQLQALKAQINPHFLFNSFNTLITIIDENSHKPKIAIEYVEKLSDFFRSILQYREQETISIEEELELVQNFGYLLQKRYGPNLRIHMESPPGDGYILPLTLQMLVENAVKHNVIAPNRPLDVFISFDDEYVTVKNNLQPKSRPEPSTQFGLQSIVKRYHHLSDKKVIIERENNCFEVRIPIIKRTVE